jgi:hypothetical protein
MKINKVNMKKQMIIKKIFSFVLLIVLFFTIVNIGQAQSLVGSVNCAEKGDCHISDLVKIAIAATKIILGLTGTVTLIAFVYGGFLFLISAGSSERISSAKAVIKGAVVGMAIVFLSFTIITIVFKMLDVAGSANWWDSTWYN